VPRTRLEELALQVPELVEVPTRDGLALPGWILKPRDFDPQREYPLILYVYGGPSAPTVANAWDDKLLFDQVLLDAPPSRDYFLSIFEGEDWDPAIRFTSSSFEMVRGMVGHGLGYALLATKPASAMTYDGQALVARPLLTDVAPGYVVIARKSGTSVSSLAETFAAHCRDHFAGDA